MYFLSNLKSPIKTWLKWEKSQNTEDIKNINLNFYKNPFPTIKGQNKLNISKEIESFKTYVAALLWWRMAWIWHFITLPKVNFDEGWWDLAADDLDGDLTVFILKKIGKQGF